MNDPATVGEGRTNFEHYREPFERDGFVVVPGFLTADALHDLGDKLDRYIREIVPTLPGEKAFYQDPERPETLKQLHIMNGDPCFDAFLHNEHWLNLARTLLGEEVSADELEWFNKPPRTVHPTPPHQDNYYFCLRPPQALTIWAALDSVDEANGCLHYKPGSQHSGLRPHDTTEVLGFSQGIPDYGPEEQATEQVICLSPGDAVVHHCETIHRADPNRSSSRHRRAFACVFRGTSAQRDEETRSAYETRMNAQHRDFGLKQGR